MDETSDQAGLAFKGDWHRLWFSLTERPWTALAIVPDEPGFEVAPIAEGLVVVAERHGGRSVRFVNAVGTKLEDVEKTVASIQALIDDGNYVLVGVDSIDANPSALHIIRAVSGALLVVRIPASYVSAARSTVEAIGPERVFGSVVLG
jgi:hypothetical protein